MTSISLIWAPSTVVVVVSMCQTLSNEEERDWKGKRLASCKAIV